MSTITSERGFIPTTMSLAYKAANSYPVTKTALTLASLAREASYFLNVRVLPRVLCTRNYHYHDCNEKMAWKTNSQGLFVLIHGLNGQPSIWNSHIAELEKHRSTDLFVPSVPYAGNCSLEEAALPILDQLLDYIQQHPDKPICLLGISNGARLALWLEVQLRRKAKDTAVKISNIAGVHLGSSRMNCVASSRCARWWLGYKDQVLKELAFNSQKAKQLIKAVREPFDGKRDYEFFASTEDFHIPEKESSLPHLGKGEKHHLVSGYAHSGIVSGVRNEQLASCYAWMRRPIQIKALGMNPID